MMNRITQCTTLEELLTNYLDPSVWYRVKDLAKKAESGVGQALVIFECLQMDSSHLGERSCVLVGPGRGIPSLEAACEGWLKDLPSERQYPVAFWTP